MDTVLVIICSCHYHIYVPHTLLHRRDQFEPFSSEVVVSLQTSRVK